MPVPSQAYNIVISTFLSRHSNKRKDHWGGSMENRFRIVGEINFYLFYLQILIYNIFQVVEDMRLFSISVRRHIMEYILLLSEWVGW